MIDATDVATNCEEHMSKIQIIRFGWLQIMLGVLLVLVAAASFGPWVLVRIGRYQLRQFVDALSQADRITAEGTFPSLHSRFPRRIHVDVVDPEHVEDVASMLKPAVDRPELLRVYLGTVRESRLEGTVSVTKNSETFTVRIGGNWLFPNGYTFLENPDVDYSYDLGRPLQRRGIVLPLPSPTQQPATDEQHSADQ